MFVLFGQVSNIFLFIPCLLTLSNDLNSCRVPLGFALPALDAHTAQTNHWNRPIAIPKLDARPNFWATPFNGNSRINPMSTRKGEVKSCPVDNRVVASIGRVRSVALTGGSVKAYTESGWHLRRPDRPPHQSETHLPRTLLAYTSMTSNAFDQLGPE